MTDQELADRAKEAKARRRENVEKWTKLLAGKADQCMDQFPDSNRLAAETMAAEVRKDPRLQEAVLELIVESYCHEFVLQQRRQKNSAAWYDYDPTQVDETQRGARLRSAIRVGRKIKLMEYTLLYGTPLKEATRKDLLANIRFQERQATRMQQTALWLRLILDDMPHDDSARVGNCYTEEQLRAYQQSAIKEVKGK